MPPPIIITHRNFPYAAGWQLQKEILARMRVDVTVPEHLLFIEHQPVITLGRKGKITNLKISPEQLQKHGIAFHQIERGGDITYHGPGQWTIYPLLRLHQHGRDLHRYLRTLEEMIIVYLRGHNLPGEHNQLNSGVWIDRNKIAAVGVACSAWISWHGIAINIQPDLSLIADLITPCGIAPEFGGITSLRQETGLVYDLEIERGKILAAFLEIFYQQ